MNPDGKIGVHLIPGAPLCVQVKQLTLPQLPAAAAVAAGDLVLGLVLLCSPRGWAMSCSLPTSLAKLPAGLEVMDNSHQSNSSM